MTITATLLCPLHHRPRIVLLRSGWRGCFRCCAEGAKAGPEQRAKGAEDGA